MGAHAGACVWQCAEPHEWVARFYNAMRLLSREQDTQVDCFADHLARQPIYNKGNARHDLMT